MSGSGNKPGNKLGNKEALLAGARTCLTERGWGGTTVRDIGEAAGVSHAAIGYHFGSREALLTRALVDAVDELGDRLAGREGQDAQEPGGAQAILDSFRDDRDLWVLQLEAIVQAARSEEVRAHLAEGQRIARDRLGGSLPLAVVVGLMVQSVVEPDRTWSPAELADELAAVSTLLGSA